jgi:hypothetical protein
MPVPRRELKHRRKFAPTYVSFKKLPSDASFLKQNWRLWKKFVPTKKFCLATVALLVPRREVGAYASFKKLPSAGAFADAYLIRPLQ